MFFLLFPGMIDVCRVLFSRVPEAKYPMNVARLMNYAGEIFPIS